MLFQYDDPPEVQAGVADQELTETTVLVTGSTSGIGRVAATAFGRLGAEVLVHGRNEEAGAAVVDAIESTAGTARFLQADFEDPDAVSGLAETISAEYDQLDVLCNNAGGYFAETEETVLGVDRSFHINHLAPYQLTAELLPVLRDGSRVVTTSSIAHRGTVLELDQLLELTGLEPSAAYCRSKLANVQFSNELARRLANADRDVLSNSFHPGIIPGSEFARSFPGFTGSMWQFLENAPFMETVEQGAANMLYLGLSEEVSETTGKYFARCREHRASPDARDVEKMRALWERSAKLLDISEPLAEYGDD